MIQKILIIEDNKIHMNTLKKVIEDLSGDLQVYCASNVKDAYQIALEHYIHLFIVDIILNAKKSGDISGLNFAREIREISKYKFTPLVFITSLEDPKLYSYSILHCFSYIEKPFSVSLVRDAVLHALEFPINENDEKCIYFRKDRVVYSICIKDIIYIEISRRKIMIYCFHDNLEMPYLSCKEMLQKLDSNSFIQCSRFCIVNRKYIEQIDYTNRFIKLRNIKTPVEIGVTMKKAFKYRMESD